MFNTYAHTAIDTVQSGKKQVVKTIVKNDKIAKILNDFVDSQTKYTKAAFDTNYDLATQFGRLFSDTAFYQEIQKSLQDSTGYFVPEYLKSNKTGK